MCPPEFTITKIQSYGINNNSPSFCSIRSFFRYQKLTPTPAEEEPKMSPVIIQPREAHPDASNPLKRMNEVSTLEPPTKLHKPEEVILTTYSNGPTASAASKKARETRLEQNRKAARESRRRKKVMIEDLQRSVIFFSRANGALKHQNDDLTRLLMQAQAQVSVIESNSATTNTTAAPAPFATAAPTPVATPSTAPTTAPVASQQPITSETQSSSETAPAPTTAQNGVYPPVPAMQPGATMQAMASFQQAAAAAMQVACQGMQGMNVAQLAQPSANGTNAQQAFNDTMTALAMQQAAIAAAAVPPHLMAQIVGTTPIVAMPAPSGAPVPVVPWPTVAQAPAVAKSQPGAGD